MAYSGHTCKRVCPLVSPSVRCFVRPSARCPSRLSLDPGHDCQNRQNDQSFEVVPVVASYGRVSGLVIPGYSLRLLNFIKLFLSKAF